MKHNVMLKPASSLCNLRCRYCFYCDVADLREVRSFGIMTDETMQNVLRSPVSYTHLTLPTISRV